MRAMNNFTVRRSIVSIRVLRGVRRRADTGPPEELQEIDCSCLPGHIRRKRNLVRQMPETTRDARRQRHSWA
jgi:hypothetical protein